MSETKTRTKKQPLDSTANAIFEAANEWEAANSSAVLKNKIKDRLDAQVENLTLKMLGFVDTWGRLEFRDQDKSPLAALIQEASKASSEEFLKTLPPLEVSSKVKKELSKYFKEIFEDSLTYQTKKKMIRSHIEKVIEQEVQEVLKAPDLSSLINIREFIKGTPQ